MMANALSHDILITAMPPSPEGVEIADIVSYRFISSNI